ncbi:MAG: ABC transporter ATP-binding protein [Lactobacillales bacterium]|jgi:iron complex transport system ATP-binding protein|nr:ABC transporter ATP-binding protein [Lactobacillales bacterium]
MEKIVEFTHVDLIRDGKHLLKDINFTLTPGEHMAILGLNGSGKTLMLRLISGNLWPSNGSLVVLDKKFGETSIPELKKRIGFVSSALSYQLDEGETAEMIALSGKFASIGIWEKYSDEDLERAKNLLISLGGEHLIGQKFEIFSQGERQRVILARALMANPELIILDEPMNGLDIFAREQLLATITELAASPDAPTILYVTHHTEELIAPFKKFLFLKKGEIKEFGTREELINAETFSKFYGAPINMIEHKNGGVTIAF